MTLASRDAGFAILENVVGDEELPDDGELDGLAEALDEHRAELEAVRRDLADVDVSSGRAADWKRVTAAGDGAIDALERRADALRSHDADRIAETFRATTGPQAGPTEDALEALGVARRDCATAFTGLGVPEEHADFVRAAADACTTVVSRRQADRYDTKTARPILDGVVAVKEGRTIAEADRKTITAALERAQAEWEATGEDLGAVDPDGARDPEVWQQAIDLAADRRKAYQRRAEALADGDQAAIAEAFDPAEAFEIPGFEDFTAIDLGDRDCRSMTA